MPKHTEAGGHGLREIPMWVCPKCGWRDLSSKRCGGQCRTEWRLANNREGPGFLKMYGARKAERKGIRGMTQVGDSENYPLCEPVTAYLPASPDQVVVAIHADDLPVLVECCQWEDNEWGEQMAAKLRSSALSQGDRP